MMSQFHVYITFPFCWFKYKLNQLKIHGQTLIPYNAIAIYYYTRYCDTVSSLDMHYIHFVSTMYNVHHQAWTYRQLRGKKI